MLAKNGYLCNKKFRDFIINLGIEWFLNNKCDVYNIYRFITKIDNENSYFNASNKLNFGCLNCEQSILCDINDNNVNNQYFNHPELDIYFVFIIPSYNCEDWIVKNLNSIICQTYKKWRLIYIDDNSSDNTKTIFDKTIEHYNDRVIYIKNNNLFYHSDKIIPYCNRIKSF